jgi:dTDP-glucose 4,6-dehydratase
MTRVLLTGAGGFAGSHCLEHLLAVTGWEVIATDSFRHKGKTDRITEVLAGHSDWAARVTVITHDLTAPFTAQAARKIGPVDYVLAYAAESHVDRSITDPVPFVMNNVAVMLHTLELARRLQPQAVVLISTDEVYGPEIAGFPHGEWAPVLPSNPYSASKAAQEAIAVSYWRTYGVPVQIVNSMNMFGERASPEKYVPKVLKAVLGGQTVSVHGSPGDIGTRHWLHARNLADGVLFLLRYAPPAMFPAYAPTGVVTAGRPDRYNIASPDRVDNLTLARMIADAAGCDLKYQLTDFHHARPGHDAHYGLDPGKIRALGWKPPVPFEPSLIQTVRWSMANPAWLDDLTRRGTGRSARLAGRNPP